MAEPEQIKKEIRKLFWDAAKQCAEFDAKSLLIMLGGAIVKGVDAEGIAEIARQFQRMENGASSPPAEPTDWLSEILAHRQEGDFHIEFTCPKCKISCRPEAAKMTSDGKEMYLLHCLSCHHNTPWIDNQVICAQEWGLGIDSAATAKSLGLDDKIVAYMAALDEVAKTENAPSLSDMGEEKASVSLSQDPVDRIVPKHETAASAMEEHGRELARQENEKMIATLIESEEAAIERLQKTNEQVAVHEARIKAISSQLDNSPAADQKPIGRPITVATFEAGGSDPIVANDRPQTNNRLGQLLLDYGWQLEPRQEGEVKHYSFPYERRDMWPRWAKEKMANIHSLPFAEAVQLQMEMDQADSGKE